MSRRAIPFLMLMLFTQGSARQTRPALGADEAIRALNDLDAGRRDEALLALLNLPSGTALAELRRAAILAMPLSPEQRDGVRIAAEHFHLAALPYERGNEAGLSCLGVRFSGTVTVRVAGEDVAAQEVEACTLGLPAYAKLRPRDLVVGIGPLSRIRELEDLRKFVASLSPETIISIRVVRAGELREVRMAVAPRPKDYDTRNIEWEADREAAAEAWWAWKFEASLTEAPGASTRG